MKGWRFRPYETAIDVGSVDLYMSKQYLTFKQGSHPYPSYLEKDVIKIEDTSDVKNIKCL